MLFSTQAALAPLGCWGAQARAVHHVLPTAVRLTSASAGATDCPSNPWCRVTLVQDIRHQGGGSQEQAGLFARGWVGPCLFAALRLPAALAATSPGTSNGAHKKPERCCSDTLHYCKLLWPYEEVHRALLPAAESPLLAWSQLLECRAALELAYRPVCDPSSPYYTPEERVDNGEGL